MVHYKKNRSEIECGSEKKTDPLIKDEVVKHAKNGELPCAVAFEISKALKVSFAKIGKTADLLDIKIIKCQLGLFGYKPHKKKVKPQENINKDLTDAINNGLVDGKLPCKKAWDIAGRFKIGKMAISGACETLNIKITACQLGLF